MSNKPKTKEEYSFERKKKLAARISDMRDKDTLRKIRDIIFAENPEVSARKSSNGYLMYFQNYNDETYHKIEKFLNKLERDKLEKQTRSITETSEQMLLSSEADDPNTDYTVSRTRLRYSNREKRLIKRRQYENIINEKIIDTDEADDNDDDNNDETEDKKASNSSQSPETVRKVSTTKVVSKTVNAKASAKASAKAPTKTSTGTTGNATVKAKSTKSVTKTDDPVDGPGDDTSHDSETQKPVVKNTGKTSVKPTTKPSASKKKSTPTIFSKVRV